MGDGCPGNITRADREVTGPEMDDLEWLAVPWPSHESPCHPEHPSHWPKLSDNNGKKRKGRGRGTEKSLSQWEMANLHQPHYATPHKCGPVWGVLYVARPFHVAILEGSQVAVIISHERLVVRRHVSWFMSPFQDLVACRNLPLTGPHKYYQQWRQHWPFNENASGTLWKTADLAARHQLTESS